MLLDVNVEIEAACNPLTRRTLVAKDVVWPGAFVVCNIFESPAAPDAEMATPLLDVIALLCLLRWLSLMLAFIHFYLQSANDKYCFLPAYDFIRHVVWNSLLHWLHLTSGYLVWEEGRPHLAQTLLVVFTAGDDDILLLRVCCLLQATVAESRAEVLRANPKIMKKQDKTEVTKLASHIIFVGVQCIWNLGLHRGVPGVYGARIKVIAYSLNFFLKLLSQLGMCRGSAKDHALLQTSRPWGLPGGRSLMLNYKCRGISIPLPGWTNHNKN